MVAMSIFTNRTPGSSQTSPRARARSSSPREPSASNWSCRAPRAESGALGNSPERSSFSLAVKPSKDQARIPSAPFIERPFRNRWENPYGVRNEVGLGSSRSVALAIRRTARSGKTCLIFADSATAKWRLYPAKSSSPPSPFSTVLTCWRAYSEMAKDGTADESAKGSSW